MVVAALGMFAVEQALPPLVPLPGIKPGLANIITLIILYAGGGFTRRDAAVALAARLLLSALVTGNVYALFYSAAGGVLSLIFMCFLCRKMPILVVSVAGGMFHNMGQLLIAALFLGPGGVIYYLPVLLIGGAAAGLLTGITARLLLDRRCPLSQVLRRVL